MSDQVGNQNVGFLMKLLICLSKFFRDELRTAEAEIDRVKDVYVTLCEEKERLEGKFAEQWKGKMDAELKIVSLRVYETFSYSTQLMVAEWLGRQISDQGVPGSNPGRCTFRCGLEQVTSTLLSTVEPRKRWTDNRLRQTVTRLEITLCLMC